MLSRVEAEAGHGFVVVSIETLPYVHGPFRCPHAGRFQQIEREHPELFSAEIGKRWYQELTHEQRVVCEYHQADWRSIADASVRVLDQAALGIGKGDLTATCAEQGLVGQDLVWLLSLFADPILWRPGAQCLENGQHRLCAARAAGAERVAVDTEGVPAS